MHTCSPASIFKVSSSSAARSPRITVTRFKASRAGLPGSAVMGRRRPPREVCKALYLSRRRTRLVRHLHFELRSVFRRRVVQASAQLPRGSRTPSRFFFAYKRAAIKRRQKREVFASRGGGVIRTSLSGNRSPPCQAGLLPHSRDARRDAVR